MIFWGASSVSLVFIRLLHLPVFSCYRPHTLPLSGQEWNSAPKTTRFWAGKDAFGCWVTEREDEVQDCMAIRERRWIHAAFSWLSLCIQSLSPQGHLKYRHISITQLWSGSFLFVFLWLAVFFFPEEKYFLCQDTVVCHSCSTNPHTHTHRIVGGRGETLWSGLRSLQLSWCTLTDLCSQERERKMEVEDVERCLNAFFLSLRNAKLQPCHNDASATLNSRNH